MIPEVYRSPVADTLRYWRERMMERGVSEADCRIVLAKTMVYGIPLFIPGATPDMAVGLANSLLDELNGKPAAPVAEVSVPGAAGCDCDLSGPRIMPLRYGGAFECPKPFGLDVRVLVRKPNGDGNVFVPVQEWMLTHGPGNRTITSHCNPALGWHCVGHKTEHDADPMEPSMTGTVKGESYRVYYDVRAAK